jgi:Fe-S-cluster-containing dehydrogenase component/anaerobic selenocysteine-containing dehydrogenase
MSRREPHVLPAPEDGAKVFWKSLSDMANPAGAQKRAQSEESASAAAREAQSADDAKLVRLRRAKDQPSAVAQEPREGSIGRRGFMFFAGASAALAAEGCARRPVEKIMPYSKAPEHVLPGVSNHYATVRQFRGEAIGIVVESHEGRPTKIEGNREHPSSRGATDLWSQSAIFELYDPDRSATPMRGTRVPATPGTSTHQPATWNELDAVVADIARTAQADGGAKLRLLVEPTNSPTFIRLRDALKAKLPQAKIHVWSSVNDANAREGARLAFGQAVNVIPDYAQAKVILALDSDFLGTEPGMVRATQGFAAGRKLPNGATDPMSRLYVVEPTFTNTGMNADHRLRLAAQDVERYLVALAKELADKHAVDLGGLAASLGKVDTTGIPPKWLSAVAKELAGARAKSILVAGIRQPARVHALVHALNAALGNAGHTVNYFPAADPLETDEAASLKALVADMEKSAVGTLVILGGNPVYDAPADLKFAERLRALGGSLHLSAHFNETSEACLWHAPRAHELEAWGDQRALDGTVAIQQPLIAPLFSGRSDIELLARLAGESAPKGFDLVQQTVRGSLSSAQAMTRTWAEALKKGVLGPGPKAYGPMDARKTEVGAAFTAAAAAAKAGPLGTDNLEVTFAACPKLYDGRYANNPLLLELPDPVNKVTWDNVACISKATAQALGVDNGSVVRLTRTGAQPVDIAVWITPGQADNSIGVVLGWGRQKAGRYGDKHGFDVSPLRTTDAMWIATGVKAAKLNVGELDAIKGRLRKVGMAAGESPAAGRIRPDDPFDVDTHAYKISQTQEHDSMEGRPLAIDATLEEYKKQAFFPYFPARDRKDIDLHGRTIGVRESGSPDPTTPPLWPQVDYSKGHKWGMAIDLTSCTGCNACVIACQIENNVPAVGKEQIWRGREMYWLRVDRYFVGLDPNDPQIAFQPVACVQCEEAPCENVCPVNATEHSPEGLNDMAYNRCIGTRYCANNCPYKVRRFNFLNYHTSGGSYDDVPETEKMHYNPNVTVRMRGVMEKCTYCVQRIQEGKIKSKRTGEPIKDGSIVSACQQACPAGAIVFGDLNDPTSAVAKWRAKDRSYRLLAELGTHPRTSYLGKIRNLNSEMEGA